MKPYDNGCSVLGATEFAWLKDYMEPLRERFESDSARDTARTELCELKRENQSLKQLVAELSHSDRSATSFFNREFSFSRLLSLFVCSIRRPLYSLRQR